MVNENVPRSEAEKYLSEEKLRSFDEGCVELVEIRKKYPRTAFWPVETDW